MCVSVGMFLMCVCLCWYVPDVCVCLCWYVHDVCVCWYVPDVCLCWYVPDVCLTVLVGMFLMCDCWWVCS